MQLRNALLAATVIAAPVAAMAQPVDGLYVGAGAGYNYLDNLKVHGGVAGVSGSGKLQGEGGFVGSLSVGYGLGNGLRLEVQGDYRQDHQKLKNASFGAQGGDSNTLSYGGYLNALFDFDIGSPIFFPYVGAGVGYRELELQSFSAYLPGVPGNVNANHNSGGGFSAQGIAGVGFAVPGVPGLSLTAEYRFTGVFEKVSVDATETFTSPPVSSKIKADDQYNHSFLIGLRYAFDAAPPPPPPAAAPMAAPMAQPARTYLVFFDWDRADLTARARQIIAEAASNATKVQTTRIEVSGHADRSGTPAYNQKLSLRRADNVAAELVRLGIPKAEIDIMAYGDTRPLVPTAAGVREPQNRRVEIVLK